MFSMSIRIVRVALIYFRLSRRIIFSDSRDRKWAWAWNNYVSARSLAEAANVRAQILRIMERLEIDLVTQPYKDRTRHHMDIRRALVCGYFMQVAHKTGLENSYLTVKDNQVQPLS
jgi:pre-mRNA-splicing factor ATP-dependent RNA helicase DHX15/PRP43